MRAWNLNLRRPVEHCVFNINLIEQAEPHVVAIFGADHIYRMNIAHMIAAHQHANAACTVAAIPMPRKHASELGVIETSPDQRILAFHEKNPDSPSIPGDPEHVFASMGNYLFATRTLLKSLHEDAAHERSTHDFTRRAPQTGCRTTRDLRLRLPDE